MIHCRLTSRLQNLGKWLIHRGLVVAIFNIKVQQRPGGGGVQVEVETPFAEIHAVALVAIDPVWQAKVVCLGSTVRWSDQGRYLDINCPFFGFASIIDD